MSKILHLNEARQHTLSAGPKHLLRLVPGRNIVDDKIFDAVFNGSEKEKTTRLQSMIEDGTVVVHGETLDITKMKIKHEVALVEMETTIDGLEDLMGQEDAQKEPRKKVVKAIEIKIDAMLAAEAAPADEE